MTAPFSEYRKMTKLQLEQEVARVVSHDCARHGRKWQCRRCAIDKYEKCRRERDVKKAYRAKGLPESFCKTMAHLDELRGMINERK